jgi:hypothetical protein
MMNKKPASPPTIAHRLREEMRGVSIDDRHEGREHGAEGNPDTLEERERAREREEERPRPDR